MKGKSSKRVRHSSKGITIQELWERDKGICALCDLHVDLNDATRDHKIPKARGGSNKRSNLQLMHAWCNKRKADGII
jgi:5-methylcytosine-specific restriction endonuclease McrA